MSLEFASLESAAAALNRALGVTANKAVWQALTVQVQEAVNAGVI